MLRGLMVGMVWVMSMIVPTMVSAAPHVVVLSKDPPKLGKGLGGTEIDDMAKEIMQQAPPPVLVPQSPQPAPHHHTEEHAEGHKEHAAPPARAPEQQSVRLEILQEAPLVLGKPLTVRFRLHAFRTRQYLTFDDLKEVHTKKIHLLMIDQTLTDYQHLHPAPEPSNSDVFTYTVTPNKQGAYRVWADITLSDGTHQVVPSYIRGSARTEGLIERTLVMQTQQEDVKAALTFSPSSLKVGEAAIGSITVTDTNGKPLTDLQPILGAFAHIVAINEDRKTLLHVHPLGDEPSGETARGKGPLQFHFEPSVGGITKVFAQIRRNGKEITLPFSVHVVE